MLVPTPSSPLLFCALVLELSCESARNSNCIFHRHFLTLYGKWRAFPEFALCGAKQARGSANDFALCGIPTQTVSYLDSLRLSISLNLLSVENRHF